MRMAGAFCGALLVGVAWTRGAGCDGLGGDGSPQLRTISQVQCQE
jgi:hypothetical protein